jgi:hypothetical protein
MKSPGPTKISGGHHEQLRDKRGNMGNLRACSKSGFSFTPSSRNVTLSGDSGRGPELHPLRRVLLTVA